MYTQTFRTRSLLLCRLACRALRVLYNERPDVVARPRVVRSVRAIAQRKRLRLPAPAVHALLVRQVLDVYHLGRRSLLLLHVLVRRRL